MSLSSAGMSAAEIEALLTEVARGAVSPKTAIALLGAAWRSAGDAALNSEPAGAERSPLYW